MWSKISSPEVIDYIKRLNIVKKCFENKPETVEINWALEVVVAGVNDGADVDWGTGGGGEPELIS